METCLVGTLPQAAMSDIQPTFVFAPLQSAYVYSALIDCRLNSYHCGNIDIRKKAVIRAQISWKNGEYLVWYEATAPWWGIR